jgi:hypothetical protein
MALIWAKKTVLYKASRCIEPYHHLEIILSDTLVTFLHRCQNLSPVIQSIMSQRSKSRGILISQNTIFAVSNPGTNIWVLLLQVNLEYLARVAFTNSDVVYPDSVVGTGQRSPL